MVHQKLRRRQRQRRPQLPRGTETPVDGASVDERDGEDDADAYEDDNTHCIQLLSRIEKRLPSRTFFRRRRRPSPKTR